MKLLSNKHPNSPRPWPMWVPKWLFLPHLNSFLSDAEVFKIIGLYLVPNSLLYLNFMFKSLYPKCKAYSGGVTNSMPMAKRSLLILISRHLWAVGLLSPVTGLCLVDANNTPSVRTMQNVFKHWQMSPRDTVTPR